MEKQDTFSVPQSSLLRYSPIVLVRDVLKNWLLIVTVMVVAGVAAYILVDRSYEPVYQTGTTLVVTTKSSSATVFSNLQSTSSLASVFTELLNSSVLQEKVLEQAKISAAGCSISASAIDSTNLLLVRVTAPDPRQAFLVLEALIEHHSIVTAEVIGDITVEVLQMPYVPGAPANIANTARYVRLAVMAAGVASVLALLLFSYNRDMVRSRREAEDKLSCWCLCEIHHENKFKTLADLLLRRRIALTITNPGCSFRFVETMRRLRRRVEQYMAGSQVLMVTSVMENEGKSTVAVNLALSLAKKNRKVLLVDLDLRKPACHKILENKSGRVNTADVLSGSMELLQSVVTDPLSGLQMLLQRGSYSGQNRTASLLASTGLAELLKDARKQYRYVVLDLPPMSAAPDTEYVMDLADAAILVVRQNATTARDLNKAVSVLEGGRAKLLGCVLNNVYTSGFGAHSSYGYGYGYGSYGSYGRRSKTAASSGVSGKQEG